MKTRVLVFISLAALPSFAGDKAGRNASAPSIAVIMSFDEEYSPVAVGEMKKELECILGPSHVGVQWRVLDASVPHESFSNLLVARFRGGCHEAQEEPALQLGALGHTHVSDGDILPFSDIDCTKVRRFVQGELKRMDPKRADQVLGRALGRVLAHEVYHIVGKTKRHAATGLAKAYLTAHELVSGRLLLERDQSDLLRSRFDRRRGLSVAHADESVAAENKGGKDQRPAPATYPAALSLQASPGR